MNALVSLSHEHCGIPFPTTSAECQAGLPPRAASRPARGHTSNIWLRETPS